MELFSAREPLRFAEIDILGLQSRTTKGYTHVIVITDFYKANKSHTGGYHNSHSRAERVLRDKDHTIRYIDARSNGQQRSIREQTVPNTVIGA